ncbi:MFS transporter [Nostocaceae cyanobacterium CENA357]|uniref:MFS transporter n=1 Tax=Atlanticothrix silvestris CENA357 TaxID=1725252 RepID=A0A8J7L546_9CYAN|nr:MFS transporter [Atlanticothrix silvestris]MBH8554267.1 MFS transporter [Atlanticothrix silvestris CENA357]
MEQNQPKSLNTFLIIWAGQIASILGSEMTSFAITIWAWQARGQATPISLILLFHQIPRVIASSFAGVVVDRCNRKQLMMLGDTVAGVSSIVIFGLFLMNRLEIWHLYITAAINGLFGYFQGLAYSASMSMIVPKRHYTRAAAMSDHITQFGSTILAPALAGTLYYTIGLGGILAIDLCTFLIAIATIWSVHIPQPERSQQNRKNETLWQELTFGFRYIIKRSSLLAILLFLLVLYLVDTVLYGIHSPLILARSNNDATVYASVQAAIGVGGVVGALLLSVWGGFKRRIHGFLLGTIFSYASMVVFGLGNSLLVWMIAGFFAAFFWPFISSSSQAIWLSKVEPEVQGRVFASRYLISQIASPVGLAISGPLADYIFSPAMQPDGSLASILGRFFGTVTGAGMAVQYTLFAFFGVLIGLAGYTFRKLRDVEIIVPDYGVETGK